MTFKISEHKDGFWFWDNTRKMNLSMKAKSKDDAFTDAILYYQNRVIDLEQNLRVFKRASEKFIEDIGYDCEDS